MEQPKACAPTMREIATVLKMSVSTVSMALHNNPRVALKTRQQIQAVSREMGYHLNPSVTALMSRVRSSQRAVYRETLGWLNPFERADFFTNPGLPTPEYSRMLWQAAVDRAVQLGYELDSFWLAAPGMNSRRMNHILACRGIRGLLIPPISRSRGHLSIDWRSFASVAMTYTVVRPELHRVVPDHHNNLQLILRTLRHRGYNRPGLLIPPKFDERVENRLRSAFYFHQQALAPKDRIPILLRELNGEDRTADWLKKYRPDVVITQGGFRHLREIDIGAPEYSRKLGIVLIGFATTDAGYCAIHENPALIAASAVDHLVAQLNRNEKGLPSCPQTVLIKGTWIEGETLPNKRNLGKGQIPLVQNPLQVRNASPELSPASSV